jgi:hypothetical protein
MLVHPNPTDALPEEKDLSGLNALSNQNHVHRPGSRSLPVQAAFNAYGPHQGLLWVGTEQGERTQVYKYPSQKSLRHSAVWEGVLLKRKNYSRVC